MASKNPKFKAQSVIKHPGSFRAYCKKHGFDSVTQECIERGKKSKSKKIQARARLAESFAKWRKKK